jgi:hypothetical protein
MTSHTSAYFGATYLDPLQAEGLLNDELALMVANAGHKKKSLLALSFSPDLLVLYGAIEQYA